MAGETPRRPRRRRGGDDPWADAPDRFDRADREWATKWSDQPKEGDGEAHAPGAAYVTKRATPGYVGDAYGDGMREAGSHLGTGMQIAASMVFFVGLGIVVDRWLETTPWGTLVGATLGMAGILALVMRMAREGGGGPPSDP